MLETHVAEQQLFNVAFDLLGKRKHTTFELQRKLARKQFATDKLVGKVIKRLTELNLLDDELFAREWISYRSKQSPRGARLLQYELRKKGIDGDTAHVALSTAELDELKLAKEALAKRTNRLANIPTLKLKNKLAHFLQSRGFNSSAVFEAVTDYLANKEVSC